MGQVLHWGLLQGREPVGMEETCVHNELAEVGGGEVFLKVTEGGLVWRSWVEGSEEADTVCLKALSLSSSFHHYIQYIS